MGNNLNDTGEWLRQEKDRLDRLDKAKQRHKRINSTLGCLALWLYAVCFILPIVILIEGILRLILSR